MPAEDCPTQEEVRMRREEAVDSLEERIEDMQGAKDQQEVVNK